MTTLTPEHFYAADEWLNKDNWIRTTAESNDGRCMLGALAAEVTGHAGDGYTLLGSSWVLRVDNYWDVQRAISNAKLGKHASPLDSELRERDATTRLYQFNDAQVDVEPVKKALRRIGRALERINQKKEST